MTFIRRLKRYYEDVKILPLQKKCLCLRKSVYLICNEQYKKLKKHYAIQSKIFVKPKWARAQKESPHRLEKYTQRGAGGDLSSTLDGSHSRQFSRGEKVP